MTTAEHDQVGWPNRAQGLASKLAGVGALNDPAWRAAFEMVPRHVFIPRFWALDEYNAPDRLVDGAAPAPRDEWLAAVYSDQLLAVQWASREGHRMITSSASLPSLVAHMLELVDARDGQRVLEIGTGDPRQHGLGHLDRGQLAGAVPGEQLGRGAVGQLGLGHAVSLRTATGRAGAVRPAAAHPARR